MKTSLVLLLLSAAFANAQSPGAFAATGNMITPRFGHTATLLLNGKVLITGGAFLIVPSTVPINTAELYDPSTGSFTRTGDMTRAPYGHVATLLPDGRVLIIGGDAVGSLGAELYDPSTGTFTPTGSMAASHGPATLLNNGKVLMTGGLNADLYDPATGTFTATGAYADLGSAYQLTTTLLADGRVLITGCAYKDGDYCDYVPADVGQLYDPATGAFSLTGAYGFRGGTTTLLTNGKVLFAGGENLFSVPSKLYDPSTGTFTRTGDMTIDRDMHTATLLPDGRVLITGSRLLYSDGQSNPSAELYDPSTGTFRSIGNMTARRGYHAATLLKDGGVLITGGVNLNVAPLGGPGPPPTNLSSAELYTPPVLVPAPALFSISGDGQGQGAIWHAQTGQIASAGSPAVAGEVLSMYTTSLAEGGVIPPRVAIGGRLGEVLYFGASGYPGYNQLNFRVPSGVAPGAAISVRLTYLSRPSNAVTIGVQ